MRALVERRSRRTFLAALLGFLMMTTPAPAGVDVKVNQDVGPFLQNETSITVNRGLPGNVVVGYNDGPGSGLGLGISYSNNLGATWTDSQTPSVWGVDADPAVASDLLGNVFASMISYSGAGPLIYPTNGIYVSRSTNGGATWGLPTTVDQQLAGAIPAYFTDKSYIAVDPYAGSPFANNVYVTWQRDNANGVNADIFFAWSGNQAASFNYATGTPAGRISDLPSVPPGVGGRSSNANAAVPAVAPDGAVYAAWQDAPLCIQSSGLVYVDKSTDGGQTWGTDVTAASYNTVARYPKGGISFQVRSFPSIAVSPVLNSMSNYDVYVVYAEDPDRQNEIRIESDTPGASSSQTPQVECSSGHVYSVWVDGRNSASNGDIYFNRSADNGLTWGTDVRLNTGALAGAALVQTPRIAADLNFVYVVWEDRRNGSPDIYYNYSADFGATWLAAAVRLDTGTTPGADNSWAPEVDAHGGNVYVVWSDDRNGDGDVLFNYSNDAGTTWQTSALRIDKAPAGVWSNLPQISCQGPNAYVTWWDARNGNDDIFVNVSNSGGATWQAADTRLDTGTGLSGQPRICSEGNAVYVGWVDQKNGLQDIYFNRSTDNGATWLAADIRLDTGDLPGASSADAVDLACSGTNVCAVWSDYRNGQADVRYNVSTDNGATWLAGDIRVDADYIAGSNASAFPQVSVQGSHVYVAYVDYRHGTPDIYFRYSVNLGANWYNYDIRLDAGDLAGANASISPQLTSDGSHVYAVWTDSRNGNGDVYFSSSANYGVSWRDGPDDGDIMLVRSADGGATWSAPVRVNNDVGASGQFQPWIKVKPNGVIDVVWFDRRNDLVNDSYMELYLGTSGDRGATWVNNAVSDVVLRPGAPPAIWPWPWMGEYVGIDVDATHAYIVWTDTRNNDLDVYFDRYLNPVVTGVPGERPNPETAYLARSVPNPLRTATTIAFGLAERGAVSLRIYDVTGKVVRSLVDGERPAGHYREAWDGRADDGSRVPSGVYFCRLVAAGFAEGRKLVVVR